MHFRTAVKRIAQPLTHFTLQIPQHPANLLQGETLPAQFCNYRDLYYLIGEVDTLMAVVARRDDMLFVPPLQLTQAYPRNPRNVAAGIDPVPRGRKHQSRFSCFEHLTPLSYVRVALWIVLDWRPQSSSILYLS